MAPSESAVMTVATAAALLLPIATDSFLSTLIVFMFLLIHMTWRLIPGELLNIP